MISLPTIDVALPTMASTGPAAATIRPNTVTNFCTPAGALANLLTSSVIFLTICVIVGIMIFPILIPSVSSALLRYVTEPAAFLFIVFAIFSAAPLLLSIAFVVLSKSFCDAFTMFAQPEYAFFPTIADSAAACAPSSSPLASTVSPCSGDPS